MAAASGTAQIKSNPDNSSVKLTIGSKNFTEEFILGEIYAQALRPPATRSRRTSTSVRR